MLIANRLIANVTHNDLFSEMVERSLQAPTEAFVSTAVLPMVAAAVAGAYRDRSQSTVVVVADDLAARDLANDLVPLLTGTAVSYYPSRGVTYESHLAPPPHLVGLRSQALDSLAGPAVVVVSSLALMERVPGFGLRPHSFSIEQGDEIDLVVLAGQLTEIGYRRVDQVEQRGDFGIRGGIVDIYPATGDRPVRCELFGDEVERMAAFSPFTQRAIEVVESVEIAPASEIAAGLVAPNTGDEVDISELLPLDRFGDVADLIPANTRWLVAGDSHRLRQELAARWEDLGGALRKADLTALYAEPDDVTELIKERTAIWLRSTSSGQEIEFRAQSADPVATTVQKAEPELKKLVQSSYAVVVTWSRKGELERAAYNLNALSPTIVAGQDSPNIPLEPGLYFTVASLGRGFISPQFKLALIPDHRLVSRRQAARPEASKGRLLAFTELAGGDTVVHEDHGICRFTGFDTRTVAGITRDYLCLEFEGGDSVFLPVDQMDKVSRYIGGGDAAALSKLGGKRWERLKSRARKAAQAMAGDLIDLYARREAAKGVAFSPDSEWQLQFEHNFPFAETPDQAEAIEAVKADMESPTPMDRLICGDVGYGKTEVAMRAAFKCASDGKQVMFLVPTTVLAQQHEGTFKERFQDFPINIGMVSRFRTAAENRKVLAAFTEGKIDILIGTHRLLSRDVRPKDIGLLIVDEEQRFGVKQKELLKQIRSRVDVLTMSATPIPRTLRMSLEGLRNISVIETPPEGRKPVHTYVGEYDEALVKRALLREHTRGGQSFFLHNRVESIEETAERLRSLCPKIAFATAHGQQDESELEKTMLSFLRGEIDCLVCTSIVESGLDIPQANTLIVERSDRLGLAQLYQIRGRVGRSREAAYAYLLYPSAEVLTKEAAARLAALSDYTELGAGFKVAMRDLELRGAGNLLGDEQSGHVAAVGFELYCEMLERAVQELSPEGQLRRDPVRLDAAVEAYIPAQYIPYEAAKVDVYRRVSAAAEVADLRAMEEELSDRFGPMPPPVLSLIQLQEARVRLGQAGAETLTARGSRVTIGGLKLDDDRLASIESEVDSAKYGSSARQLTVQLGQEGGELPRAIVLLSGKIAAAVQD